MTLQEYMAKQLASHGPAKLIKKFGVVEATLYHWRRGVSLPRTIQMEMIVKDSKGKVSYAGMIEPHNRRLKAAKQTKTKH